MKRCVASLVLILSLITAGIIFSLWRSVHLYLSNPSKENLVKVITRTPSNPNAFYRMGLYCLWSIEKADFQESMRYFISAIERNPLEQKYWIDLAKVLNRLGQQKLSEEALEKAIFVFPTGYAGRWATSNLMLQLGAFDKALPHFSYILAHYPEQRSLVYEILWKFLQDPDLILDRVVPQEAGPLNRYLLYLYERGDKEAVIKAWARKTSLGYRSDRDEVLRHIDFLITQNEFPEAYRVWNARLKEEGLPGSSDGNRTTNGSFEKDKILGGGFDWKLIPVSGASVSFDSSVAFEGKRSLRIDFDGKENVDFRNVYQYVSWEPDSDYLFKARVKTRELTTKSGVKVEILGIGPPLQVSSETLTGDNGWKEIAVSFHTPAGSQGGMIRVRREKTEKFDRFISGTVWLDDFNLTKKRPDS